MKDVDDNTNGMLKCGALLLNSYLNCVAWHIKCEEKNELQLHEHEYEQLNGNKHIHVIAYL